MRQFIHRAALIVFVVFACVNGANARNFGLLVGVSGYPAAPDGKALIRPLQGPRNDVTVMWRLLRSNGFSDDDITVLADGLPVDPNFPKVSSEPTRSAILSAFADLESQVGPGDFAYIHLSSHGSLQPSTGDAPQPYGRNQVMLPIDVRKAPPGVTSIPNGIVDVDLGRAVGAIRAKGAHVWVVVDMCHAGDSIRAASPDGLEARHVEPEALGIPFPASSPADVMPRGGGDERGAAITIEPGRGTLAPLIGFFAVDPRVFSYEKSFRGYATPLVGEEEKLGVFTYLLHRVLTTSAAPTYRDLGNAIVREIQSGSVGYAMPLPVFQGDLDAPVFGSGARQIRKGWPGRHQDGSIDISGGALHGITEQSVVAIHRGLSDSAPGLGRAVVTTATSASSQAALIKPQGDASLSLAADELVWTTLVEPAVSFVYRISEPPADDRKNDPDGQAFSALDIIKQEKVNKEGVAVDWRPPAASDADLHLRIMDGYIWLVPATGEWPKAQNNKPDRTSPKAPPAVPVTQAAQTANALFDALWTLARAQNLVRVASRFQAPADDLVTVSVERYSVRSSAASRSDDKKCPDDAFYLQQLKQPGIKVLPGAVPSVTHCDLIVAKAQNKVARYIDAATLFLDGRGGITLVPAMQGSTTCSTELPPSANAPTLSPTKIVLWDENGKPVTAGTEYIIVLALERADGDPPLCFNSLAQPTLETAKALPAARGAGVRSLLIDAGLAEPGTRSAQPLFTAGQPLRSSISVYTLSVDGPSTLN
jgi:hypothetical protein